MNIKIVVPILVMMSMFMTVSAVGPTTEHHEGNWTYDGPNENLEASADWDFTVTERPNRHVVIIDGEANAHLEYTYVNEEDHREFVGANGHIDGRAKFKYGGLKRADIHVNGNVYQGYENTHHIGYETYRENGYRYTVEAYDMTERYEHGYEFEGYLKVRNYQVRPASYFTWTPYEQYIYDHSNKVVKSEYRSQKSLETGIVDYLGLPEGTLVPAYTRTSTANAGEGIVFEVQVPEYVVGEEPWKSDPSRLHNRMK